MSLGPVMVDVAGTALCDEERGLLSHPQVGGVILFTRNFQDVEQLTRLCADIRALRKPHLLIAVDQEGGRVQRFREPFTRLPPMQAIGREFDREPSEARRLAGEIGWLLAAELRAVGVDLSFAPVLDLVHGRSGVIGDRAFHRSPEVVADLAHHLMAGMARAGMAAVGKHFPGHGGVREDSHLELPVDGRPWDAIRADDLLAFERMIHFGLPAVMPAHVVYSEVDPEPAGFSRYWIGRVLRRELGFTGAVFSDDLSMSAAAGHGDYPARARAALDAGCDMVLVCNHPEGARAVVESLAGYEDPTAQVRIARLHGRRGESWEALHGSGAWAQARAALESLPEPPGPELNV
jgi:beta-N-acetylhexosaminidase